MTNNRAAITSFHGEYRFLSNFWPCRVVLGGHEYRTVEHAYVAAKTLDDSIRAEIRSIDKPGEVKRFGRRINLRQDWDSLKLPIMADLVTQKFTCPGLRALLAATAPADLIEGNTWGDTFWGVCNGAGSNHLGRILMEVRNATR